MKIDDFCEIVSCLRQDVSRGRPMPYKPLLLTAVIVLIHKGKITSRHIFMDGGLRSAFEQLLYSIFPDWPYRTKVQYPFRHLENDGVWKLIPFEGASGALRSARASRAEAWEILRHVRCAVMDKNIFNELATNLESRLRVLKLLWEKYLPPHATKIIMSHLMSNKDEGGPSSKIKENDAITEKAFEEYLEQNWRKTPFARMGITLSQRDRHGYPGRQVLTPVSTIDLLGFQRKEHCWWVFELKRRNTGDVVVGQISRYLGWILQNRASNHEHAVGAIIAPKINPKLRYALKANPKLSLWTYDSSFVIKRANI